MYSYKHFTPGKNSNSKRMINYVAEYNAYYPNSDQLNCVCVPDKYDKSTVGSDSPSVKISNNMRISQIIQSKKGGSTQFGNFYLGQPLSLNYLGRMEGMPGGGGMPPKNKF